MTGWKTVIVAALIAIVGALQGLDWIHLLPSGSQATGWVITGLGVVMAILRAVTSTTIGSSTPSS